MNNLYDIVIPVATDAEGDANEDSAINGYGYVDRLIVDYAADFGAIANLRIMGVNTGKVFYSQLAGATDYDGVPSLQVDDEAGVEYTGARKPVFLNNEPVNVLVDTGGAAKLATVRITVSSERPF
jgi:hypothetical protein